MRRSAQYIFPLLAAIILIACAAGGENTSVPSGKSVSVFCDGAQVQRNFGKVYDLLPLHTDTQVVTYLHPATFTSSYNHPTVISRRKEGSQLFP